ncbi:Caltractin [Oopsacas minuta]|uniref:Caltractin n=1 Tax=Oopsacas minuta TaxID=111878 RepID=A0AAV7JB69_9METZ|nr:Caltractin [Oopsacas minuta]
MSEHIDKTIEVKREYGDIERWRISDLSKSEEEVLTDLSSIEVKCDNNKVVKTNNKIETQEEELKDGRRVSVPNRRKAIALKCQTEMDNISVNSVKPMQIVEAFKEVFNLFDLNGGGTIDADELEKALCSVDIKLTQEEIIDILVVIDDDGNGKIDFYEFLHLMTSTEKFLESRDDSKNKNSQSLLFSALTKFMRKTALSSMIEWYYHKKERKYPHVVAHYAAGARVIGLTEKKLPIQLANNRFNYKTGDSPYCQPICRLPEEKTKPDMEKKIKLKVPFHNNKRDEVSREKKDSLVKHRGRISPNQGKINPQNWK